MQHRVFGAARCRKSLEAMAVAVAVAVAVAASPRRDAMQWMMGDACVQCFVPKSSKRWHSGICKGERRCRRVY